MAVDSVNSTPLPTNLGKAKKRSSFRLFFGLFSLFFILVGLVGYLIVNKKPVTVQKKAFTLTIGPHDNCGKLTVSVVETPQCQRLACPNGVPESTVQTSSYSVVYRVESNDGQTHTVKYGKNTNFCAEACGQIQAGQGQPVCWSASDTTDDISGTVGPNNPLLITLSRASPTGAICGSFQTDFWIKEIDGSASCNYNQVNGPGAATVCQTGITCTTPSATPTPTGVLSPTPTLTPTQTPTPTVTPTGIAGPTSTPGPSNTPTPGPSATPTTGPSATPIPVGCGTKSCDNSSNPCRSGMTCVQANDGSNYCSMPEFVNACKLSPSQTSCCTAPGTSSTPAPTTVAAKTTEIPSVGVAKFGAIFGAVSFGIILLGLIF